MIPLELLASSSYIKINSELFAVIIGASLTGVIALMTWLIKSVIRLSEVIVSLEERLERLEER